MPPLAGGPDEMQAGYDCAPQEKFAGAAFPVEPEGRIELIAKAVIHGEIAL